MGIITADEARDAGPLDVADPVVATESFAARFADPNAETKAEPDEPNPVAHDYELDMIDASGSREGLAAVGEAIGDDTNLTPAESKKWGEILQTYVDDLPEPAEAQS